MEALTEIRWHGRGGQGAKTAALLLAEAAFNIGKHVQGFPEYGPERMGAPITAYDRISDGEIRVHSNIYEPDYVAVVDDTLLHTVDVTKGLKTTGGILINTQKEKQEILPLLNGYQGKIYLLNAYHVCMETMGQYFPNTPMLRGPGVHHRRGQNLRGGAGQKLPQHPYAGGISEDFRRHRHGCFFRGNGKIAGA